MGALLSNSNATPATPQGEQYKPEPYDLRRPSHLLAKDVLRRLEDRLWAAHCGVNFGADSLADVEQLIRQFYDEIEKAQQR